MKKQSGNKIGLAVLAPVVAFVCCGGLLIAGGAGLSLGSFLAFAATNKPYFLGGGLLLLGLAAAFYLRHGK